MKSVIHGMMLSLALLSSIPGQSAAEDGADGDAGRLIVERWCVTCHTSARSGSDVAPSMATIARARRQDPGWVRNWLSTSHPPMPDLALSRRQINDVVAYLQSLKN